MFVEGANGVRPIGDGLLEVSDASLSKLIASGDINEIYDVEHTPFARGKFATVRRAIHKQTGVSFAAKFLRRRRRAQCTLKEIRHEIAILLLCSDSEHIVKLHSVHETMVETALVLEMANGGELQSLLDEAGSLSEHQTIICMQEVLKALQFLHKKCIAHLDLKPQNILLCGKRVEDGLKLCDFGISRIVEETGSKVREILGTPDYVAPEVLSYEPLSLKTDIWSVGVLAYVLLSGFSPFGGDTKQETFLNISQCNLNFPDGLFEDVSEDAKDFIKSALQVAAEDRMSAVECLEHKWLSESSQPLKASIIKDSTTTKTNVISTNDIIPENHHVVIEAKKLQQIDSVGTSPTPSLPSPPKASAGFFLHQTPKNGTALLDEVLFSSLNNGFNTTANNTNASKTLNGIDHHHNHHNHHHQQQYHAHHHNNHSMECAKQNTTLNNNNNNNNNSCNNINNPNDKSDLLKDYATNKENINLSKILANRIAPQSTASTVNNLQLISNLTTLHNNNSNNSSNNGTVTMTTYADESSSSSTSTAATTTTNNISSVLTTVQQSTANAASVAANNTNTTATTSAAQTKHETVLFPDAPTTPKVLRKSNQSDADHHTPSCVALVKQFQLNNGTLSNNQRIDFDEIVSSDNVGLVSSTQYHTTQSTPPNRSKFANLTTDHNREILPSYRLSATAITTTTTNTTNGHHSLGSSTLSINTLTESSVGVVTQQHSNSTITMNCLCGADKTVNCCCNSSSRAALNYRKKSLAVVDSSILC
ncbi:death-associated protein kinase related [Contarinia nasturtii]|uniref:death-associated protein kinase related n=1 Tax=Contarinia nasturtii TaxID=265458 RepID=UPI0012D3DCCE|nr:death-associated protein kinase related [Contarinia nasturtii]